MLPYSHIISYTRRTLSIRVLQCTHTHTHAYTYKHARTHIDMIMYYYILFRV